MLRRLFTVASAVSLLLCLAVVVQWVRSYWVGERLLHSWFFEKTGEWYWVQDIIRISRGEIKINRFIQTQPLYRSPAVRFEHIQRHPFHTTGSPVQLGTDPAFGSPQKLRWGFWLDRLDGLAFDLILPLWLPCVFCSLLPACWAYRRLRLRRSVQPNRCRQCGYDLRATPDRCPECGTLLEKNMKPVA